MCISCNKIGQELEVEEDVRREIMKLHHASKVKVK